MDVSIIVPCYNLENYISYCIKSILIQTYKDFELIIVNDGSTDNSLEICKKLQEDDSRIQIINQKNQGVSVARNIGIENSQGEYIMFIDGDDVLTPNAVEVLLNNIKKNNALLSCGKYMRVSSYKEKIPSEFNELKIFDSYDCLTKILNGDFEIACWAKIFRSKNLKNVHFEKSRKVNEDKYFLFNYLLKNEGIICMTNTIVYGYYVRENSMTMSPFSLANMDAIYFSKKIITDIKNSQYSNLLPYADYNHFVTQLSVLKKIVRSNKYKEFIKIFKEVKNEILENKIPKKGNVPIKYKIEYYVLKVSNHLYIMFVNLHKKIKYKGEI